MGQSAWTPINNSNSWTSSVLTSVSLHTEKLWFWRISTTASFIMSRANRIPMQFRGPAPNGMYVYGSMAFMLSLLNLKVQQNTQRRQSTDNDTTNDNNNNTLDFFYINGHVIYWAEHTQEQEGDKRSSGCTEKQDLSGLNASGSGHNSGSRCMGHVGTMTTISFGITRPFISTVALATRSRRCAMGYNLRDSLMTLSRYSICISGWYWIGACTHTSAQLSAGIPAHSVRSGPTSVLYVHEYVVWVTWGSSIHL